jgi:hypothetical protein
MKAVTTPAPWLVVNVAEILPYHTVCVLVTSVPTVSGAMVSSMPPLYSAVLPLTTQSMLVESPR